MSVHCYDTILPSRNGIFDHIQELINLMWRLTFKNYDEMFAWLYAALRESVPMKTYFDYKCWGLDIPYNDEEHVFNAVQAVYPDFDKETFSKWWEQYIKDWEKCNHVI